VRSQRHLDTFPLVLRGLLIAHARRSFGSGFREFRDAVQEGWKGTPPPEPPPDETGVREPRSPQPTPGADAIELPEQDA
jgi:hypothetical protein